jgi:hypothetical protein
MKIGAAVIICNKRKSEKNLPIFGRVNPEPVFLNASKSCKFKNGEVGIVISEKRLWESFPHESNYAFIMVLTSRGSYWFRENNLEEM